MMKKVRLMHDDLRGFYLADFYTSEFVADVNVGDVEDDIDWNLIEQQAKEIGCEVDQSDYNGTFSIDVE